jgi:hypothetical protein
MAGSKYDACCRNTLSICQHYPANILMTKYEVGNTRIKADFTPSLQYAFPDLCHYPGQFISTYMGVCVDKNIFPCPMRHKDFKDTPYITALLAPRIKLTIAIGAGTSLTKAVVTVRVNNMFFINGSQVSAPGAYVFTSL